MGSTVTPEIRTPQHLYPRLLPSCQTKSEPSTRRLKLPWMKFLGTLAAHNLSSCQLALHPRHMQLAQKQNNYYCRHSMEGWNCMLVRSLSNDSAVNYCIGARKLSDVGLTTATHDTDYGTTNSTEGEGHSYFILSRTGAKRWRWGLGGCRRNCIQ